MDAVARTVAEKIAKVNCIYTVWGAVIGLAESFTFEELLLFPVFVLRNHGAITVGASIREALFRTLAIEEQATIQCQALQVGTPTFLSEEECARLDELGSEAYRRKLLAAMRG